MMSTTTRKRPTDRRAQKRKEDPRFIQGQGNFVDDLSLPGMLWMCSCTVPMLTQRSRTSIFPNP